MLSDEILNLNHADELIPLIRKVQSSISEYCFSNLYLFRKQHDYRVWRKEGFIFIQGVTYDNIRYIMPLYPLDMIPFEIIESVMSEGFCLFPIEEKYLSIFNKDKYDISYNIDDSDYVYRSDRIKTLPGRKLSKKRNLLKQYRSLYQYEDVIYTPDRMEDAFYALDKWLEINDANIYDTDYEACKEAIIHYDQFGLTGKLFYADETVSGLILGEELSDDTFALHFAKGITDFKGIYTHMYVSLAELISERYEYINFEQDLGKENLRKAKSVYMPDNMIHKYRIKLMK